MFRQAILVMLETERGLLQKIVVGSCAHDHPVQ